MNSERSEFNSASKELNSAPRGVTPPRGNLPETHNGEAKVRWQDPLMRAQLARDARKRPRGLSERVDEGAKMAPKTFGHIKERSEYMDERSEFNSESKELNFTPRGV